MSQQLIPYWPKPEEIRKCIIGFAEEVDSKILLATHEPMVLTKLVRGIPDEKKYSEQDLLSFLLEKESLIPISGDPGVGKTHLLKWLDAKLKETDVNNERHIVRIPKSSSPRRALELFIKDLPGEHFQKIRTDIERVREKVDVNLLMDLFVVKMKNILENDSQLIESQPDIPSYYIQSKDYLKLDLTDPFSKGLLSIRCLNFSKLINDDAFISAFKQEGAFLHQTAMRFLNGTEQNLRNEGFEQKIDQEVFLKYIRQFNPDDLSIMNRNNPAARDLNHEHYSILYFHLFNCLIQPTLERLFVYVYSSIGRFSDIFLEIRKTLKSLDKEIFVLIEDLAQVPAIENDLITSLTKGDRFEDLDILCKMHSIAAVTSRYSGFERLRDTILSRVDDVEWSLSDAYTLDSAQDRIYDFVGRYINATRLGYDKIKEGDVDILNIDIPNSDNYKRFQLSPHGYPLFPLNKNFVNYIANPENTDRFVFRPRQLLGKLRNVLEKLYYTYVENKDDSELVEEDERLPIILNQNIGNIKLTSKERQVFLYWCFGNNESLENVKSSLNNVMLMELGVDRLLDIVNNQETIVTIKTVTPTVTGPKPKNPPVTTDPKPEKLPETTPDEIYREQRKNLAKEVNAIFKQKNVSQQRGVEIRKELLNILIDYSVKNDLNLLELNGLQYSSTDIESEMKQRDLIKIFINFNAQNPSNTILKLNLGSNIDLEGQFLLATFSKNTFSKDNDFKWGYKDGLIDYINYKNFIDQWIENAIQDLCIHFRRDLQNHIKKHIQEHLIFNPSFLSVGTNLEKMNLLFRSVHQESSNTGINKWEEIKTKSRNNYQDSLEFIQKRFCLKNQWGAYGYLLMNEPHGFPMDELTANMNQRNNILSLANYQNENFSPFMMIQTTFFDVTNKADFETVLTKMVDLYNISVQNKVPGVSTLENDQLIRDNIDDEPWLSLKSFISINSESIIDKIISLNGISISELNKLLSFLNKWDAFYNQVSNELNTLNININVENVNDRKENLKSLFLSIRDNLKLLKD